MGLGVPSMAVRARWHGIPEAIDGIPGAIDGFWNAIDGIRKAIDGSLKAGDGFGNPIDGTQVLDAWDSERCSRDPEGHRSRWAPDLRPPMRRETPTGATDVAYGMPAPTVIRTGMPAGSNPSRQYTLMPK